MNLAACDRQRAAVFEITPRHVVVRMAEDHLLACTNHFRTPDWRCRRSAGVIASSRAIGTLAAVRLARRGRRHGQGEPWPRDDAER